MQEKLQTLDLKNEIGAYCEVKLPAILEVFELRFLKAYKKLRLRGSQQNPYYLVELPKEFVNGNYSPSLRYSIVLGVRKTDNHRVILLDLDDVKPLLSANNRREGSQ